MWWEIKSIGTTVNGYDTFCIIYLTSDLCSFVLNYLEDLEEYSKIL